MATTNYTISGSGTATDVLQASFTTSAAAAIPTTTFFIAPIACTVAKVETIWDVASGATSTVAITHETGTTAAGGGNSVLTANIDMSTTRFG